MSRSRVEDILHSKIEGTEYPYLPRSRIEAMLLQLNTGEGGGTVDPTLRGDVDVLIEHAILDESTPAFPSKELAKSLY